METPPQNAQSAFPPPTGVALASLALGIAAVGLSFLAIGCLFGIVGAALGFAYLNKKRGPTAMARWGVGLSLVGILASLGFLALYIHYVPIIKKDMIAGGASVAPTGALANPAPLPAANPLLQSNIVWSAAIPAAQAVCVGDWENDGSSRVLVAAGKILHVLDLTGAEKSILPLPERFTAIECGRNKTAGARLLGYTPWGRHVLVIDHTGKILWTHNSTLGVDGAHWGDLNGDGNDEMIVGMNGFGGLLALSPDGKELWSASLGNVWSQAVIPAAPNRPALVLATDARGSVNMFDAAGARLKSVRPEGGYYSGMTAGAADSNTNSTQIIGFSGSAVAAFDQTGKVAWITSAQGGASSGSPSAHAVLGDFKGDGAKEWVFMDGAGDLILATTGGLRISSIPNQGQIQGFAVAPRQGQGALLLTLNNGVARAYSFGH